MKITKIVAENTNDYQMGCNPCSEILLRDKQLCNLTEVVLRAEDTEADITRKVRLATILGTIQSSLTKFHFVSSDWKKNCEEERLLGVSLTGIYDSAMLNSVAGAPAILVRLREHAGAVNREWAGKLSIPASAAITCVKPSGTVSQLVDSASGIHPRYAAYYIRNVRMDNKDPVCSFMKASGIPNEPDANFPTSQTVFSFPVKAPTGATTRNEVTAIQHLELWKVYQEHWCEHKPSVTVSVRDNEWMSVGAWVYENFDAVSGVAFLPHSDHTYKQAPYIEVDEATYNVLKDKMPKELKWSDLVEASDTTVGSQELACGGKDSCELV